ncbi:MAG: PQQ-binding-like beta-propeller repeat protein [Candidatus Marinimicrobia bacterium]|jgi:outer membrane protein assembly factor BamB|nr:PQQ-binding-like beta-propeller repeat protein [Candidatus Neomarinimicrobiota bacterium]MDP6726274.1 PQQ-binding-like beta-propeller repeat protein [Candidatus Neomarinimicrobiota bacterium]|tara:strand:+ start:154 stop:1788 length:1635 start_codon:yes stop_codon:yes gene_type:complete
MKKVYLIICFLTIIHSSYGQGNELWYYDVNDMSFGNSACADIDDDGLLEIVFSCYRNDSTVYALNAENGSLLWKVNTGGCNDVAPLIWDVDQDGELEVILPSSCVAKTFCYDGLTGNLEWFANTRGSDSPPTVADIDNDGKYEILHGEFGGYVICINGEDGSVSWEIAVNTNSWVQTAPAILDVDDNGQLDFIVATWVFGGQGDIYAYTGDSALLIWEDTIPSDFFYHGASFADIDGDNKPELTIGCYDGNVYALNAEDGSHLWTYFHPDAYPQYVGAPTSIADLNNDELYEIVFINGNRLGVLSNTGDLLWDYPITGYSTSFRGAAISDINNDDTLDVVFGTSAGELIGLSGGSGSVLFYEDIESTYGSNFEIDHAPIIADFNNDSINDIFVVGGHAEYPDIFNNYGRAYAFETPGGKGTGWPMFRFDERRSGCYKDTTPVVSTEPEHFIPEEFVLHQNYPNPFNPVTTLRYDLPEQSNVNIIIYDIMGREVKSLINQTQDAGFKSVIWNATNDYGKPVSAGVYLYQIQAGEFVQTKKMVLLK